MATSKITWIKIVFTSIASVILVLGATIKTCKSLKHSKITKTITKTKRLSDMDSFPVTLKKVVTLRRNIISPGSFTLNIPANFTPTGDYWKIWRSNRQFEDASQNLLIKYFTSLQHSDKHLVNWKKLHDDLEFIDFCLDTTTFSEFVADNNQQFNFKNISYSHLKNDDTIHGYSYYFYSKPKCYVMDFESINGDSIKQVSHQNFLEFFQQ